NRPNCCTAAIGVNLLKEAFVVAPNFRIAIAFGIFFVSPFTEFVPWLGGVEARKELDVVLAVMASWNGRRLLLSSTKNFVSFPRRRQPGQLADFVLPEFQAHWPKRLDRFDFLFLFRILDDELESHPEVELREVKMHRRSEQVLGQRLGEVVGVGVQQLMLGV